MKRNRRKSNGFTLVELLIALAITALILSVIYTTLTQGFQIFFAVQGRSELHKAAQSILRLMGWELEQSFLGDAFVGQTNSISFSTHSRGFGSLMGSSIDQIKVEYFLARKEGGAGFALMRRESSLTVSRVDELADGIYGLEISYFEGPGWKSGWNSDDCNCLPRAVRITLALITPEGGRVSFYSTIRIPGEQTQI